MCAAMDRNAAEATRAESGDRAAQIDRVIHEVMHRRRNGVCRDDSVIIQRYAHLMPELGERLRTLQMIEAARVHLETESGNGRPRGKPKKRKEPDNISLVRGQKLSSTGQKLP